MLTINNVINLFKNITAASPLIQSFGYGEQWEINEDKDTNNTYPKLWLTFNNSNVTANSSQRTFTLYVYAVPRKDKSDEIEIISDTEQILNDIIAVLRNASQYYSIVNDVLIFPFKEKYGDWCTGWSGEITLESVLNTNRCDIPIDPFYSPTTDPGGGGYMPVGFNCDDLANCPTIQEIQATLASLSDIYVPYLNANKSVDLNTQTLTAGVSIFNSGAAPIKLQSLVTLSTAAALYMNQATPAVDNYTLVVEASGDTTFNSKNGLMGFNAQGSQGFYFYAKNTVFTNERSIFQPRAVSTGAQNNITISIPANIGQTASTNISSVFVGLGSRKWLNGDITLQEEFKITGPIYSHVSGSNTITTAATLNVYAPTTSGGFTTIVNSLTARFNGKIQIIDGSQANGYVLKSDANGVASWGPAASSVPALTSTQIAFGDNSNLMTSASNLTFNTFGLNVGNATLTNQRFFRVGQDTAYVDIGSRPGATNQGAIYINAANPTSNNYVVASDGGNLLINAPGNGGTITFQAFTSTFMIASRNSVNIQPVSSSASSITNFSFLGPNNTNQTASLAVPSVLFLLGSREWQYGNITNQHEFKITAPTYSFATGPQIMSDGYTFYVDGAPIEGANMTINNKWAGGFNGNVEVQTGNLYLNGSSNQQIIAGTGNLRLNSNGGDIIFDTQFNLNVARFTSTTLFLNRATELISTLKIVDGSEGSGKVFTSDASGNGSWQTLSLTGYVPYIGATADVQLGLNNLFLQGINQTNGYIHLDRTGVSNGLVSPTINGETGVYIAGNATGKLIISSSLDNWARIFDGVITANRTYTWRDASGTIALLSDITAYTGTTNRITVTSGVINIAATFVGQTSITTLGTITTGVWNGTAVSGAFVDNNTVINKTLAGYTSGAGTITSSDSILTAIQKLNGNDFKLPIVRYVYLVGDASDATRMGGTANNVYSTFQAAYNAANTIQVALGAGQLVAIMVGNTVSTLAIGNASTTVGGVTLTAAWNIAVCVIGQSPMVSVVGDINGDNASGNGFAIQGVYFSNVYIGASGSIGLSSRATGASGNGGAINLRVNNCAIKNGIDTSVTNASNTTGNGGLVTISGLSNSNGGSGNSGRNIFPAITTSAQPGGSGLAGTLTMTNMGDVLLTGNITTANNCDGGSISIGLTVTNVKSINSPLITMLTTSPTAILSLSNVQFGNINASLGVAAHLINNCVFTLATSILDNGSGQISLNIINSNFTNTLTTNSLVTTVSTDTIFTNVVNLGANSKMFNCSVISASGTSINGLSSGCELHNCSISGGSTSINNGSAVSVLLAYTTFSSLGTNITITNPFMLQRNTNMAYFRF